MNQALIQRCLMLIALLSGFCLTPAWAGGTITHLSGNISVQTKDGATLVGMIGVKVNEGDIMITGGNGYARLEMTDGGEIVLRPNSKLKIENYHFNSEKPAEDRFVFRMLKGGLRTVTGFIGKRGNKDAYEGKTETATVGIRGTQFDMRFCQGDCGALADGTYLAVRFGAVRTGNAQGSMDLAAGQVALVPPAKPPVLLPRDPGVGFTPPPVIPKLDEKKKQSAAATTTADTAPAQEQPSQSGSQDEKQENKKEDKKEDKQQEKKQDSNSDAEEKPESSESSGADGKSEGKKAPDDSGQQSGGGAQGGSDAESGGKPEPSSASSGNASSDTSSGTGGGAENPIASGNNLEPISQDAQGAKCSIQ